MQYIPPVFGRPKEVKRGGVVKSFTLSIMPTAMRAALALPLVILLAACTSPGTSTGGGLPPYARAEPLSEPVLFAPGVISTDGFELGITFSPDGRTAYFAKIGEGFKTSVIVSSRFVDGQWSQPQPVSFAGPYRDLDMALSSDGTKLFFQSDRPLEGTVEGTGPKDWDIWVAEKTADGWSEPRNLGAPINTPHTETFPVVVADGTLYFSSDRPGGSGENDIYRSRFVNGSYTKPENLGAPLNDAESNSNAFVAPDESYIILGSPNYSDTVGGSDLYASYHRDGLWTEPKHLPLVNTEHREFAPSVSPDGRYLFFTSFRPAPGDTGPRLGDIYQIDLDSILPRR